MKRDRNVEIETLKEELRMLRDDNRRLMDSKTNSSHVRTPVIAPPHDLGGAPTPSSSSAVPAGGSHAQEEELDWYREHVRKVKTYLEQSLPNDFPLRM